MHLLVFVLSSTLIISCDTIYLVLNVFDCKDCDETKTDCSMEIDACMRVCVCVCVCLREDMYR